MTSISDTIAAIATGMNQGGIGVIRVSGSEALAAVDNIFVPKKSGKEVKNLDSYTAAYGNIINPKDNSIVDEVIVLVMKAPSTYTREDVVEIDCHGGMQVMKEILHLLISNNDNKVRLARPGEFTERAFLNGRIDLSQAESVMDLISAKSEIAAKTALSQLKGSLKNKITDIRKELIHNIAFIESALDDPEHYSLEGFSEELKGILNDKLDEINHLIQTADNGKMMREGIHTVILGKPNAGKSSILNVLAGKDRAIVTDVAGTTRDTLEEFVSINGIPLNIIDTAGIRDTDDIVEKIGVDKSIMEMEEADLILYIIDSSVPLDENDKMIMERIKDRQVIILSNKSDLNNVVNEQDIRKYLDHRMIEISAKEQSGFEELYEELNHLFFNDKLSYNDEIFITNERHKAALINAQSSITNAINSIDDGMPEDFYTIDLMSAYEQLGFIIGESVEDDLVDTIFREFCMGK
ncbi:MAG: tRNA uridine-5-carboxymethylaminomethyl(34) synthesis GTPase MnmE [Lachnospiraceae bacterium]|nr:tRNA uridine-5-carboxymethylaminomethyl(34) synthesis GTPase MnmE [Lachnospiraceae bacterium]